MFAGIRRTTAVAKSADPSLATFFAAEAKEGAEFAQGLIKQIEVLTTDSDRKLMVAAAAARIDAVAAQSRNLLVMLALLVVAFGVAFAWWLGRGFAVVASKVRNLAQRPAGAAALVEPAAAAAGAMQDQAAQLAEAVSIFKLDAAAPRRLAAPARTLMA